jgi:hypothetical protein
MLIIILNSVLLGLNILIFTANLILEKNGKKEENVKLKNKPPKPKLPEIDINLKEKNRQKSSKSIKKGPSDKSEIKSVENREQEYLSEEDLELNVPKIPEAPRRKRYL